MTPTGKRSEGKLSQRLKNCLTDFNKMPRYWAVTLGLKFKNQIRKHQNKIDFFAMYLIVFQKRIQSSSFSCIILFAAWSSRMITLSGTWPLEGHSLFCIFELNAFIFLVVFFQKSGNTNFKINFALEEVIYFFFSATFRCCTALLTTTKEQSLALS